MIDIDMSQIAGMYPMSLLENPPLDNHFKIICHLKGKHVHLTGKNVLFLQFEYSLGSTEVSLKSLTHNLWESATFDQKRKFESIARNFNLIDEKTKRRYYREHQHDLDLAGFFIYGARFP